MNKLDYKRIDKLGAGTFFTLQQNLRDFNLKLRHLPIYDFKSK